MSKQIHPALHFGPKGAAIGIVDSNRTPWLVTSKHKKYSAARLNKKGLLTVPPLAFRDLANRWDQTDIEGFLAGDEAPTIQAVEERVKALIDEYFDLRRDKEAELIACWIVGTYFFPLFPAFPRLHVQGERGSGKSKLLHVVSALSFNGLLRLNSTPAVLFRLIDPVRPTLCLDEMEALGGDDRREILSIINAGYKAGGAVDRVEGEDRHIASFEVYTPLALAGISGLNAVTEDRAITITMERGRDPRKLNRDVNPTDPAFARIRAGCYRLALTRFKSVRKAWEGLTTPAWLVARHRELYAPLLTITRLADEDEDLGLTEDLLALARAELPERGGISLEGEALLQELQGRLRDVDVATIRPGELVANLSEALGTLISAEQVGHLLKRFGFTGKKDKRGTTYSVSRDQLGELATRYGYAAADAGNGDLGDEDDDLLVVEMR